MSSGSTMGSRRCRPPATVSAARSRPSQRPRASNRSVGRWLENLSSRISTPTDTPNNPLGISWGAVPAATIAETLGQLADYGCTVMILIDAFHEKRPLSQQTNRSLNEWARTLDKRNVITFIASIHGPSDTVVSEGHGAFAKGILDSLNVRGRERLTGRPQGPLTLFEFQDCVARNIHASTGRKQHARCYIPDAIPSQITILDPPRGNRSRPCGPRTTTRPGSAPPRGEPRP